jgi:hypothetical protein
LVGRDNDGDVRVVLEAKFQAELTEPQVDGTYLERVSQGGVLLYLAPANRLTLLWRQLRNAPGTPALTDADTPALAPMALSDGRWLAVASWEALLEGLQTAVTDSADADAMSDLNQLDDLVRWRIGTDWIPLAPGDLPQRVGQQSWKLTQAVVAAIGNLGLKYTNGTSDSESGRWLIVPNGPQVWAGLWPGMLGSNGETPLWLILRPSAAVSQSSLNELLQPAWASGMPVVPSEAGWAIPLHPPYGAELPVVVNALEQQIRKYVRLVSPATAAQAPSPAGAGPATPSAQVEGLE